MIYSLTLVGAVLTLVSWHKLRELDDDRKSIAYATVSGILEFLAIFSFIGILYSVLQFWINSSAFDPSDFSTIREMEGNLVKLRHTLLPVLDLNKWIEFAVITLLAMLGVISPKLGRLRLIPKTKVSLKWLRRGYISLTILASFTFLVQPQRLCPGVEPRRSNQRSKMLKLDTNGTR